MEELGKAFKLLIDKVTLQNLLLTILVSLVSSYLLQSGVHGILWLVCWASALYSTVVVGSFFGTLILSGATYLINALAQYSNSSSDNEHIQALNDVYDKFVNKKK